MAIQYLLLLLIASPIVFQIAYADTIITVNATTPCFLNNTASYHMLQNCDASGDWLKFALLPFEWVTGGYFSLILVSVFILFTWIKYHKVLYPILIGIFFIPISYTLFPETWVNMALILVALGLMAGIFKIFFKQTREW